MADKDICSSNSRGIFYHENPNNDTSSTIVLQMIITILTTHLVFFILRPLKQPRIVSDIIGGLLSSIVVFPSLLSWTLYAHDPKFRENYLVNMARPDVLTITRTMSAFAIMFKFFLIGVKIDPSQAWKGGRKGIAIGLGTMVVPLIILHLLGFLFPREKSEADGSTIIVGIGKPDVLFHLAATVSATTPSAVADVLLNLQLLNTELGRLVISASIINEITRWTIFAVYQVVEMSREEMPISQSLSKVVWPAVIMVAVLAAIRVWIQWIMKRIPKGSRIHQGLFLIIVLVVMVVGSLSDGLGLGFMDAPMLMGLLVPDGPPLGMALVRHLELIINDMWLPLFFFGTGWATKFKVIQNPMMLFWLMMYMVAGHVLKTVVTIAIAVYFKMPLRKAIILGLMTNFNGLVQIIVHLSLKNTKRLTGESYVVTKICIILVTGVCSLLVSKYYDPLNKSHIVGNRALQYLNPHEKFCVVASVLNEDPVRVLLNLIEVSCIEDHSSAGIYVLHLVELGGRGSASLTAHRNSKGDINPEKMDRLHNAFINYEKKKKGVLAVHPFTAVSPYTTMHQDICSLAIDKNVPFVIVPFPRKDSRASSEIDRVARSMVPQVLSQAPCSVGILIHHTLTISRAVVPEQFRFCVRVFFWGGNDDREALSYVARMARHPGVRVFVTRFLPLSHMMDDKDVSWDEMIFKEFMRENMNNERVLVEEVAANDVNQTIAIIKSIDQETDLVVVGRQQNASSFLNETMAEWIESPELGVVGDMLASSDFSDFSFSVLVIQQHV